MNIPDQVVVAFVVPVCGLVVWAGRQFIKSTAVLSGDEAELTVPRLNQIGDALIDRMNGRYPKKQEMMEEFNKVRIEHEKGLIALRANIRHDIGNLLVPVIQALEHQNPSTARYLERNLRDANHQEINNV